MGGGSLQFRLSLARLRVTVGYAALRYIPPSPRALRLGREVAYPPPTRRNLFNFFMHKDVRPIIKATIFIIVVLLIACPFWLRILIKTADKMSMSMGDDSMLETKVAAWIILIGVLLVWLIPWLIQIILSVYIFNKNSQQSDAILKTLKDIKKKIK